eukprot:3178817-Rhodomonas_salina.1
MAVQVRRALLCHYALAPVSPTLSSYAFIITVSGTERAYPPTACGCCGWSGSVCLWLRLRPTESAYVSISASVSVSISVSASVSVSVFVSACASVCARAEYCSPLSGGWLKLK